MTLKPKSKDVKHNLWPSFILASTSKEANLLCKSTKSKDISVTPNLSYKNLFKVHTVYSKAQAHCGPSADMLQIDCAKEASSTATV